MDPLCYELETLTLLIYFVAQNIFDLANGSPFKVISYLLTRPIILLEFSTLILYYPSLVLELAISPKGPSFFR